MPLTTPCPVRYILMVVDGTMEWYPLPLDGRRCPYRRGHLPGQRQRHRPQ